MIHVGECCRAGEPWEEEITYDFDIAILGRKALLDSVKYAILSFVAMFLSSCGREGGDAVSWEQKKTIIELRNRLELVSYQLDRLSPAGDLEDSGARTEALRVEITELLGEKRRMETDLALLRNGWDDFCKEVLAGRRDETVGKTFEEFESSDGRLFRDAKVTRVDDAGVSMTHADGSVRLRFDDLDTKWHAYFGIDGEFARAAQEAEAERRIAYERQIDMQLAVISEKEAEQRKEWKTESDRLASARAVAATERVRATSALSASIGALGETSTVYGGRYRNGYHGYYRRPTVRYNYTNYYIPSSSSGIPFWSPSRPGYGTGACASPIQIRPPFYLPNQ